MKIEFQRLVSRNVANFLEDELQLAGVRMPVNQFLRIIVIGGVGLFLGVPLLLILALKMNASVAAIAAVIAAAAFEIALYALLEFRVEQRKSFVENLLPDYLQLVSANVRSGIALDKAMVLAARPEFSYFSEDVKAINKELYAGVSLQGALQNLGKRYRSMQLQHTVRMMVEGIQYGGGMTDLLNQIAKDMRNQHMVQKEISGQLFMYTLFIAFAALIGAPALYALTAQMIAVTNTVWAGILSQNPSGLPSMGISFLKPSPPQISIADYRNFSIAAVLLITGFGAFIVSAIASGSIFKGIKYLPAFLIIGIAVFFVVSTVIGGIFSSVSGI